MDRVLVRGLEVFGHHGVFAAERELGQTLVVDLAVGCDLRPAGQSDDVAMTLSYVTLVDIAREVVRDTPYQLLEAVAEAIAQRVLMLPRARQVEVRIEKPRAPIPDLTGTVAIEIVREKG
jgi:dihydroneopterin aldolase